MIFCHSTAQLVKMCDARYDGVFDPVSAAIGVAEHYTTAKNLTLMELELEK